MTLYVMLDPTAVVAAVAALVAAGAGFVVYRRHTRRRKSGLDMLDEGLRAIMKGGSK